MAAQNLAQFNLDISAVRSLSFSYITGLQKAWSLSGDGLSYSLPALSWRWGAGRLGAVIATKKASVSHCNLILPSSLKQTLETNPWPGSPPTGSKELRVQHLE